MFLERSPRLSFHVKTDLMFAKSVRFLEVKLFVVFCSMFKFKIIVISFYTVMHYGSYRCRYIGKNMFHVQIDGALTYTWIN